MEVLSGPWADLALLLQQSFMHPDRRTDSFLPLWIFTVLLFVSVTLLLLQLIVYCSWQLRRAEADVMAFSQDGNSIYGESRDADQRKRRSAGCHSHS